MKGLLALFLLLLAACCSTQRASPEPSRNEVVTESHGAVTPTDDPAPLPATFDCNAPPPLTPCCRALLPKCTQCTDRNRAIEEAYRAQCGPR